MVLSKTPVSPLLADANLSHASSQGVLIRYQYSPGGGSPSRPHRLQLFQAAHLKSSQGVLALSVLFLIHGGGGNTEQDHVVGGVARQHFLAERPPSITDDENWLI